MKCANCSSELPANARFCMFCGQPVEAAQKTDDNRLTRLTASVPAPLAEKIRAAKLSGERKVVTALFADVVGSTAMAEQMDPEDWTEMMNGAFDKMSPIIYHYEGTIARLLGDAVLAFFGAPISHEDDPARATRAALEILEAMREYASVVKQKYNMTFAIRVGINTGSVVVGDVGSDLKYEYTAMGDAINIASRLQSAAQPMTALISQNTYRFIQALFNLKDLGQIELKGKSEPIQIYEVESVKSAPGKVRGLAGLTSPMVGREAELNSLKEVNAGLEDGKGGVVVITGEAGLGKSRLLAEWKQASADGIRFSEAHCLSYGQRLAYHLVIDIVRNLIGVNAASSEEETANALEKTCAELFQSEDEDTPLYLAHLLSLKLNHQAKERLQTSDPQVLQNQYRAALGKMLEAFSGKQPQVLILEDIHWADSASVELLGQLISISAKMPLVYCMVSRPDQDTTGWKLVEKAQENLKGKTVELPLNPLSETDGRQLVSNLLEIESLPEKVRNIILSKAEGNPFFVEEVIRMLIDHGAIVYTNNRWEAQKEIESVEIPDNLQGLLLARIDRLPEEAKRTLRIASVIGRQFSARVLEQVMDKLASKNKE